jgi:hypothetical protein
MTTCINLLETLGDKYRITWDEAYSPRNVPRDKLDPWMMQIPCEGPGATIYPYGGTTLAIELNRRFQLANRLKALPGVTLYQDGNTEKTFLFDVSLFDQVAAIVSPRTKKVVSEEERARLASLSKRYGFGAQDRKQGDARKPSDGSGDGPDELVA